MDNRLKNGDSSVAGETSVILEILGVGSLPLIAVIEDAFGFPMRPVAATYEA